MLSVLYVPHSNLNQLTEFHKICYERYATGGQSNAINYIFLQSVIRTWRSCELGAQLAPLNLGSS
jgi:hypothetical protein